ncbi:hypothetical protein LTR56_019688 [Elasticomyces elasticus]|nr:hypothetical protein LTR56_019688 [Elasticomyces elasticus]KAK3633989.1 hypothetical protein LTR22_019856 [Elasticomyces elasticus]KAK4911116.1 hypothetical protein LTR49_020283 [Elasticomyces elasticus]KAK5750656.1 hypothetical protein LTS12_019277 [Elasticomyces elasticus]
MADQDGYSSDTSSIVEPMPTEYLTLFKSGQTVNAAIWSGTGGVLQKHGGGSATMSMVFEAMRALRRDWRLDGSGTSLAVSMGIVDDTGVADAIMNGALFVLARFRGSKATRTLQSEALTRKEIIKAFRDIEEYYCTTDGSLPQDFATIYDLNDVNAVVVVDEKKDGYTWST